MIVSLSLIEIIPALLAIVVICLLGLGLHRMVKSRDQMLHEYRRREQVHQMATRFKHALLHELRPLGLRRVSLAPYAKREPVLHRRRLNLHTRLFQQDLS